jgi:hypothetical protein
MLEPGYRYLNSAAPPLEELTAVTGGIIRKPVPPPMTPFIRTMRVEGEKFWERIKHHGGRSRSRSSSLGAGERMDSGSGSGSGRVQGMTHGTQGLGLASATGNEAILGREGEKTKKKKDYVFRDVWDGRCEFKEDGLKYIQVCTYPLR